MKTCKSCGQSKPLDQFALGKTYKDGHVSTCKTCTNERRRELASDPERKTRVSYYNRKQYLRSHGLTQERFDEMLLRQGGVCAACGSDQWGRKDNQPSVDHDHACCPGKFSCGKCVRGLLCIGCNVFAGVLEHPKRILVERYLAR